ncbi:MAG TPA: glycosyltransferase family 1 protein [Candidatus Desulfofervidus auxilii]|uniref:Glycosyltransferase family 1 protein n=1 Tax=Desulfofervidus auxilii TaxID=1621989 RepID=A0A7C1VMP0_DESA2|nr:glycosyltransferase family 1 protein [Candidatus Desulfofervidus auxilii]
MKLLIFNWRDIKNPEAGGAEIHLHEICKKLVQRGHEIVLISSKFSSKVVPNIEYIDGIKVIRVGNKFTYNIACFLYYMRYLRQQNFDIVIDDVSKIPLLTPFYVKGKKLAISHHIHGKTVFKELPFIVAAGVFLSEFLIPVFYHRLKWICVSESTKKELINLFKIPPENIKVIYNGINPKLFQNHSVQKTDYPTVVYFGMVKNYKRIDLLLKAFKIVSNKIPESRLLIAGKGYAYDSLKNLANKLNIFHKVKFIGPINEDKKINLLQSSWIQVIPSMKEGWGITVIEANVYGTPCIAYNVPGLRDSIIDGRTGILVKENGNVEKLAEAIYKLLVNHELRKELSQNAIEWAKRFSWDKSAEEFERVVDRIAK